MQSRILPCKSRSLTLSNIERTHGLNLSNLVHRLSQLKVIYFEESDPFPEVLQFQKEVAALFKISVIKLGMPMKKTLASWITQNGVVACFMGTRSHDPDAGKGPCEL